MSSLERDSEIQSRLLRSFFILTLGEKNPELMDLSTTRFVAATCTLFLPFEEHGKHLNTFERLLRMEQKLFALATADSLQLPEVHF